MNIVATPPTEICVGCGGELGGPCPLVSKIPGASRPLLRTDAAPHLDAGQICLWCGVSVALGSGNFVNRVPADRDGVYGWMCAECDSCEDDMSFFWCNECENFTPGNDDYVCHHCGEPQDETRPAPPTIVPLLCAVCRSETSFDFDALARELRAASASS